MATDMMKLKKNEVRIFSKFAPVTRVEETEFYGIGENNELLIVTANYLGEAIRLLEQQAKQKGVKLSMVRPFK